MNVLFWNLSRQPREELITALVRQFDIDLILIAEPAGIDASRLVVQLSIQSKSPYTYHASAAQVRLHFFSRFAPSSLVPLEDDAGVSVRRFVHPGCKPITIIGVHLASQLYWNTSGDRLALASRVREVLERAEAREQHRRFLLVGDFNSDPFEEALVNSDGLHAVMSKQIALKSTRNVGGTVRRFLYNPMWSLLGDIPERPPGSYYYRKPTSSCRFWYMFDQVLLRPELITPFDAKSLQVVTRVGDRSLSGKDGKPNSQVGSDHFPIVFRLDLLGSFANV